jgi:hypothetical protein
MLLPDDLVEFERDLEAEFEARRDAQRSRAWMDKVIKRRAKR